MTTRYAPYREPAANDVYHLLFCDDPAAFAPAHGTYESAQQARSIAQDTGAESRVRMLAYDWLRAQGHAVADKELLGTIVEVGLDDGNDTLAAYLDGNVRLTFLVADGLYFGEGPHAVLERDGMAGPVLAAATALLVAVTSLPRR